MHSGSLRQAILQTPRLVFFSPLCYHLISRGIIRKISIPDEQRLSRLLHDCEITHDYSHSVVIDEYDLPTKIQISPTAQRSLDVTNAGGKSEVSEAISMDYFERIFHAHDIILEMEVEYWIDYSMVDYVCTIDSSLDPRRVGVSVTRAMGYKKKGIPQKVTDADKGKYLDESVFTREDANHLLRKKLYGLIVSRNAVSDKHSFYRSVLHVWCQSHRIAEMLREEFGKFDINDFGLDIQGTVILLLTVCSFEGIYTNSRNGLILD